MLCLQHAEVPKLNLFQRLSPNIDNLEQIPAVIPLSNTPWVTPAGILVISCFLFVSNTCIDMPRIAIINSFGLSGTNAHAILMEPPKIQIPISEPDSAYILTLSACPKTPNALVEMMKQFHNYLSKSTESLDGIFTLMPLPIYLTIIRYLLYRTLCKIWIQIANFHCGKYQRGVIR